MQILVQLCARQSLNSYNLYLRENRQQTRWISKILSMLDYEEMLWRKRKHGKEIGSIERVGFMWGARKSISVLGWWKGKLKDDNHVLSLYFYIAWRWTTQEEEQNCLSEDAILRMLSVRCWWGFNWTREFGEQKMSVLEMLIWNWWAYDNSYD